MTYYEKEVLRIKQICFSNKEQLKCIIKVKNYIDKNFDQQISLDVLASTFLISKFHLLRLFKRYYGQTPRQYLINKRLAKSKLLLAQGTGVATTCFAVGFESPSSFSLLFKNKNGYSPIDYQKSNFQ